MGQRKDQPRPRHRRHSTNSRARTFVPWSWTSGCIESPVTGAENLRGVGDVNGGIRGHQCRISSSGSPAQHLGKPFIVPLVCTVQVYLQEGVGVSAAVAGGHTSSAILPLRGGPMGAPRRKDRGYRMKCGRLTMERGRQARQLN